MAGAVASSWVTADEGFASLWLWRGEVQPGLPEDPLADHLWPQRAAGHMLALILPGCNPGMEVQWWCFRSSRNLQALCLFIFNTRVATVSPDYLI